MNGVTLLTQGPLTGRAPVVMNRVLKKVAPHFKFEWATHINEIKGDGVIVVMADYDNYPLKDFDINVPILKARGYRFDVGGYVVVPTYSPWLVGKGKMNLIPVLIHDILKAIEEVEKPEVEWPIEDLCLYPSPEIFRAWCREAESSSFIAHDIETLFSKKVDEEEGEIDPSFEILRFSLARDDFKAITCPFIGDYIAIWKEFALKRIPAIGWNSHEFDDPREQYNGIKCDGKRLDAQWLWHFMSPTLPRGLGHVSTYFDRVPEWKSIGANQDNDEAELYAAMDARQTAVNYAGIKRAMEGRLI